MFIQNASLCLFYTTVSTSEQANGLIQLLLEKKLIGCGQVISLSSLFFWEEKLHEEAEVGILLKTTSRLRDCLQQALIDHHPYTCPVLIEIPVAWANQQALEWIGRL